MGQCRVWPNILPITVLMSTQEHHPLILLLTHQGISQKHIHQLGRVTKGEGLLPDVHLAAGTKNQQSTQQTGAIWLSFTSICA